jgi:hypothetical protein
MASPSERNLNRLREALGRDYVDPLGSGRESRTRSELLRGEGPPSDVTAPEDQDMWEEEPEVRATLPVPQYLSDLPYILDAQDMTGRNPKRVDLYSENYGQGSQRSTRIRRMQWIPTAISGDLVIGDIIVDFARYSDNKPKEFYVYVDVASSQWEGYHHQEGVSLGRFIGSLGNYHTLSGEDRTKYMELHAATKDGEPWSDWIWDVPAGALGIKSWDDKKAIKKSSASASKKRAKASSKATKEWHKRTGTRRPSGTVPFSEAGEQYREDDY